MYFWVFLLLFQAVLYGGGGDKIKEHDWEDLQRFAQLAELKGLDVFQVENDPHASKPLRTLYQAQKEHYVHLEKDARDALHASGFLNVLLKSIKVLESYLPRPLGQNADSFQGYVENVCAEENRRIVLNANSVHWKMVAFLQKKKEFTLYDPKCENLQIIHIGSSVPDAESFDGEARKSFLIMEVKSQ